MCGSEPCWKIGQGTPTPKKTGPRNPSTHCGAKPFSAKLAFPHTFLSHTILLPCDASAHVLHDSRGDRSARRRSGSAPHLYATRCEVGCVYCSAHTRCFLGHSALSSRHTAREASTPPQKGIHPQAHAHMLAKGRDEDGSSAVTHKRLKNHTKETTTKGEPPHKADCQGGQAWNPTPDTRLGLRA
jgi:hypothetical protein